MNQLATAFLILGIVATSLFPLALLGGGLFFMGMAAVFYLWGRINKLESTLVRNKNHNKRIKND